MFIAFFRQPWLLILDRILLPKRSLKTNQCQKNLMAQSLNVGCKNLSQKPKTIKIKSPNKTDIRKASLLNCSLKYKSLPTPQYRNITYCDFSRRLPKSEKKNESHKIKCNRNKTSFIAWQMYVQAFIHRIHLLSWFFLVTYKKTCKNIKNQQKYAFPTKFGANSESGKLMEKLQKNTDYYYYSPILQNMFYKLILHSLYRVLKNL